MILQKQKTNSFCWPDQHGIARIHLHHQFGVETIAAAKLSTDSQVQHASSKRRATH